MIDSSMQKARHSQAPMLSTGGSIPIIHLTIVLARVHISLLNILRDFTPAGFCGFYCSRTPDASQPQNIAFMSTTSKPYGLSEISFRLGSPLLIALAG